MKIHTTYNMNRCILCTYISTVFSCRVTRLFYIIIINTHTNIIQAEEQRKKMEKDAELLKQKLLKEQKRREVCDD